MATLISAATGNFTSSSTWALVDSTSYLDTEASTTTTTSAYVYSQTFTPGAITVDGIALKVTQILVAGNSFFLDFNNHTDTASVTTVTVNVNDLQVGWNFFKFSSSQTLVVGKAYKIGIKSTSTGQVTFSRDATSGNWSRLLRTTTTQAPASGDQLIVAGELTGAGTFNAITVTMNNTATTTFGATTYTQSIAVCNDGTLTWGTSASTDYFLRVKGLFDVQAGGTMNMGTSGTRIPANSTAILDFDLTTNVDSGIRFQPGSTSNIYGASKQRWTTMTADKATAATVIALTSTSGWANGDVLAFPSTSRTASQAETKTISTVDSSVQVTLSAGLTNAHTGTGLVQGECANLTSNVKIRGESTSLQGYIQITTGAVATLDNVEVYWMGSGTTNKRGIDVQTTTGSMAINSCSLHDFIVTNALPINITGSTANNITLTNTVVYNCASVGINLQTATTGTAITMDGNLVVLAASHGYSLLDVGGTITNNVAASSGALGFNLGETGFLGTFSGNVAHSGASYGLAPSQTLGGTIANQKCYHNGNVGINFETKGVLFVTSPVSFGNAFGNIGSNSNVVGIGFGGEVQVRDGVFDSTTSFATTYGVYAYGSSPGFIFENCTFGSTSAHTTASVFAASIGGLVRCTFRNCTFNESTRIGTQSNLNPYSFILSQRDQSTAGSHKGYFLYGNTTTDTTIYNTASPSLRLTPSSASNKLASSPIGLGFNGAVASGGALTASVYVRKSVVGDGTAYNGAQPRLIVRRHVAAGITSDTVLATASGPAGSWEQLSGTTGTVTDDAVLEFFVDCDGTTGWVNVDDFATTTVNDTKGLKYWFDGLPIVNNDNTSSGATSGYFSY